ncbi:hypothetical protein GWK47_026138 [Chionoecetes opilio]|uniref:Uncharacterized protein n=1 Tax=Chionoecetes opilio TaxID=41210 RepID=A0A8J8WAL1_CHIOP|nr:hypothetical protein GWK47_026138 [Chionoecetes opilio]
MVLRHQSLLQEGQCVVLQLAGSVIGGEELYEVLRCFHRLSLRGIHEGPSITESFEDSNVRTRGRAEAGFEDILEDHLLDMMAAGQPKQASSEFLLNPNASTLHHASVRSHGVETEGDDLVPDARFVHLLQDHCSHVSASLIRACRDPKKELCVIFPCEEDGDAVLRIAPERDGRSFPSQCRTNLSGISWFRSSMIFSAACSLPAIRARWTVLFETAILLMSIPRT